ncbi:MAG: SH3 domain-containing protein [Syntrophales bacterium]
MAKIRKALIILIVFSLAACAARRYPAITPLPHVRPEFEKAQFWIDRFPQSGSIILSADQIREMNQAALKADAGLIDIMRLQSVSRGRMESFFSALRKSCEKARYYDHSSFPLSHTFYEEIFESMALDRMPSIVVPSAGLITRETDMRELPTDETALKKPFDTEFDQFQYARLECGTPVVILHYSRAGDWCLLRTSFAMGWVKAADVAEGTKEDVLRFVHANPLVVTGDRSCVYADRSLRKYAFSLPMGASLPFIAQNTEYYQVIMPWRDADGRLRFADGFIPASSDVHVGYLPYTQAAVLSQAFKLLHRPYGWGGMFGGRDCSRFLRDVFRCFGFNMPVNSFRQSNFNEAKRRDLAGLEDSRKTAILGEYQGRPALLYMKGHIMLLLGVVEGRVYIIHSTWAYRESSWAGEDLFYIGKVVVSDASLGGQGRSGSLLERISAVTAID